MVESRRDPHPWTALALSALLWASAARGAEPLTVEAIRRGNAVEISCRAVLDAETEMVWQTLTDYERLAEFIPGMRRSRVIERRGPVAVVEQAGEASFLFLSFPLEVTLATTERPPHAIQASLLKGNLKRLDGTYRIEPRGAGGVLLTWNGTIEPLSMPPLLGEMLMRASVEDQFRGMVREIERREGMRREGTPEKTGRRREGTPDK